jgi:hypothetical protein
LKTTVGAIFSIALGTLVGSSTTRSMAYGRVCQCSRNVTVPW